MCMECGCGKKKGEVGYGKGKAATKKVEAKPAASMKKMGKKK